MCCGKFCCGVAVGMAAGIFVGMKMKCNERTIRRMINRTARNVENAFDCMTR